MMILKAGRRRNPTLRSPSDQTRLSLDDDDEGVGDDDDFEAVVGGSRRRGIEDRKADAAEAFGRTPHIFFANLPVLLHLDLWHYFYVPTYLAVTGSESSVLLPVYRKIGFFGR